MKYSVLTTALIVLIGAVVIALAFVSQIRELQIALGLAGASFIGVGLVLWGQVADKQKEAEKLDKIMEKLEKIEQELEKQKEAEPKNRGVAVADFLGAGLKYYSEHMNKKENQND